MSFVQEDFVSSFPYAERKQFKRHFIDRVFFGAKFKKPYESKQIRGYIKNISEYSIIKGTNIDHSDNDSTVRSFDAGYFKQDSGFEFQLMLDQMNLIFKDYKCFDLAKEKILQMINEFKDLGVDHNLNIIGLKKVCIFGQDNIKIKSPHFNENIFVLDKHLMDEPRQIFKEDSLVIENEKGACFIKAILNFNTTKKKFEYILDIDVNRKLNENKDIAEQLDLVNQEHFNIFSWATTAKFMKEIEQ